MQRTLKEFLARTPFFGGLDEGSLDRLSAMLKRHTFREGATIFVEGDRGASMYLIQSGEILMVRSGREGQQVRLVRLRPGDFFGETVTQLIPDKLKGVAFGIAPRNNRGI